MTTPHDPGRRPSHPFKLIDVTLRDGHQCLWSTRMTTAMMTPILSRIDAVGYAAINIMGGAVFDVMVRFLHENPWHRLRLLCDRLQTPCDALTRGQSLYTFELFADDLVALNSQVLARQGVKVLTVYDALNDNRNIVSSVRSGQAAGLQINAMLTYTLSPVHTDAYFVERALELVAMQVDSISVKDPSGLLTAERAATLFPALVSAVGRVPMQLHSHCQSGHSGAVYQAAIQAGFGYGYTASRPLANGASLPATEDIDACARQEGRATGIDGQALADVSGYFTALALREGKPLGKPVAEVARPDAALYAHQVPGGMISNLRAQLQAMGIEHRLPEILEEAALVRRDLGYPILVSPFAQFIVTQAVLNVVQGERYKTIPDEVRRYATGHYGRLAARPADLFLERARIHPDELTDKPPALHLAPALPRLRAQLSPGLGDEDLLLRAFYSPELLAPLRRAPPPCRFGTSPLQELLRYVVSRRDLGQVRIRYAGAEISLSN